MPALRAEAGRRLLAGDVDLCIADFLAASINVPACSRVPLLLFSHNVEHMIWKRLAAVERRPLQRAALELEWRKLRQFEASASVRATLTVAVSQQDAAQIAGLAPGAEIRAIPTGVDTDYFTPGDTEPLAEEIVYV
ncbi:glycosyl transferase, group 1, partial [mine drainage metagenome]